MKKNLFIFSMLCLVILGVFAFAGCGPKDDEEKLNTFSGIQFSNISYEYDGTEKEIVISGQLPNGAVIQYTNNKATNAGTYSAKVVISCEGYKTITLEAKLTISKLNYDMSNVKWNYEKAFTYDGTVKEVIVTGLPQGVTVKSYKNNKATDVGNYTASVEFNYDTVNHNAPSIANLNWKIKPNIMQMAKNVIDSISKVPDAWSFLPESFILKNKAYSGNLNFDFENSYVSVASLPKCGLGKQMNVVYSTLLFIFFYHYLNCFNILNIF